MGRIVRLVLWLALAGVGLVLLHEGLTASTGRTDVIGRTARATCGTCHAF